MIESGESSHLKTLIVEDNDLFRRSFKERLQAMFPSMAIEEAAEGNGVLEKVKTFRPHLVFMDIQLPGENGLKVTEKIKAVHPDISVIIVTNYDIPEYRNAAVQYGASHFIPKDSLSYDQLEALVKSFGRF